MEETLELKWDLTVNEAFCGIAEGTGRQPPQR